MSANSAFPNPAPQPPAAKIALMPRRAGRRKWLIPVLVVAAIAAPAWFLRQRTQQPLAANLVRTVRAARGGIQSTVRLSGSITARHFANIGAPLVQAPDGDRGLVLIYLPESGSFIKEGQVVARIDGQAVQDHLDDVEAMLLQAELDLRKRQAVHAEESEAVAQRVRVAKANLEKARLDLRTLEVKSLIDREKLKLAAEEALAVYQDAQRALTLVADRQHAELRLLDLARERQERHRNRHREDVRRFTIHAPMDGQVVLKTVMRAGNQAQVRVGDELGTGQPFLRVVDLSSMQLDATLNQAESELVHIGQPATVRFDAFPDLVLEAHVESVGALALSGGRRISNYVRQIPVRLSIEGSDSRVIPDLTASADVVFAQQDEALIVPREAVYEEGGKSIVYVKQAESFAVREVALGVASGTQVAVLSGLEAGEEIAMQPPAADRPGSEQ